MRAFILTDQCFNDMVGALKIELKSAKGVLVVYKGNDFYILPEAAQLVIIDMVTEKVFKYDNTFNDLSSIVLEMVSKIFGNDYFKESGPITCGTCKKADIDVRKQFNNGLTCGYHHDSCFRDMVAHCKQQSW